MTSANRVAKLSLVDIEERGMRKSWVVAVLFAVAGIAAPHAHAQGGAAAKYPDRPIRLVVVFPPGGATGTIAAAIVAKALPDGYTIMMVPSGPYTISASVYSNLPYDAVKDFTGVSLLAWVTNVIVVPQASPVKTLQDLIRMAKEKPGQLTFSSSGSGSLHHLSGEVLKRLTGTDMIHVPFKGAGPAMAALAGSEVTFGFTSMPSAVPLIHGKRLRALAVTSMKRMPALPDTPTMTEAGVPPPPGLDIREWYGVIAPAATPAPIVDRLNAEMVKAFKRPDVQQRLTDMGAEYVGSSPQALSKQLANDVRTWAKWVKDAGVKEE